MTSRAVVDDPVLWYEGMLLTPQHFQQHELRLQRLLRHQMEQLDPYYWGVLRLEYDPARLDDGVLQIDRLHAVLPDGLVVIRGRDDGRPSLGEGRLTLDLSGHPALKIPGSRVRVYLMVPEHVDGAASDRGAVRRYDSFTGPQAEDDNTGEDPLAVLR